MNDPFLWACYVAWLARQGYGAPTARSYLAGISTSLAEVGINVKPRRMPLVKRALLGLQRQPRTKASVPRLPITVSLLHSIARFVDLRRHEERTLWAMMTLATYGLLRSGEITLNPADQSRFPRLADWRVSADGTLASIHLPISKSDYAHNGTSVYVARNSSCSCPISAMQLMLSRTPFRTTNQSPLFSLDGMRPISRFVFLRRVRILLTRAGIDGRKYSGHSFRRGGAQSAHDAGLSVEHIQLIGRWKQVQVAHRYFGFTSQGLRSLSENMARAQHTNPLRFELLGPREGGF